MIAQPFAKRATIDTVSSAQTVIRARSPLRISFAGGGTDIAEWYEQLGGAVLSTTINRYAHVTLHSREDEAVNLRSVDLGLSVKYAVNQKPVYDGVFDLAKAAIHRLKASRGLELDVRSDAPAGSGLGGSSALTAAVIGAVAAHTGETLDNYELAELNYVIERSDLGITGGKQDQYATTFGGLNLLEFHADHVVVNPLRLERALIHELESHLLLCYTGKVRTDLGLVAREIQSVQEGRPSTLDGMKCLYQLAFEMKKCLVHGQLRQFGELLHEAYVQKKRINPHVAEGTIADELYEEARGYGALGGKLLGAGGGGYVLLYCDTNSQHDVRRALEALGGVVSDVAFEEHGLQIWRKVEHRREMPV
jgi:D-glycero-alpha-D-manno-heptose-7-phosphate kinase